MELSLVTSDQKNILKNLVKMYCYEWSQYNGIDIDENGDYAFERDVDRFLTVDGNYAYFVKNNGRLVGFVLVDKDFDYDKNSDHAISEFFILHKYRKFGLGKLAALEVFDRHKGKWEIKMHPKNAISIKFWRSVVNEATNGDFKIIEGCKQAEYFDGELGTIIVFNNKKEG